MNGLFISNISFSKLNFISYNQNIKVYFLKTIPDYKSYIIIIRQLILDIFSLSSSNKI